MTKKKKILAAIFTIYCMFLIALITLLAIANQVVSQGSDTPVSFVQASFFEPPHIDINLETKALKTIPTVETFNFKKPVGESTFAFLDSDRHLYLSNIDGSEKFDISKPDEFVINFITSNDRNQIAYLNRDRKIYVLDFKNKTRKLIFDQNLEEGTNKAYSDEDLESYSTIFLGSFITDGSKLSLVYNVNGFIDLAKNEITLFSGEKGCSLTNSFFGNKYLWFKESCPGNDFGSYIYKFKNEKVIRLFNDIVLQSSANPSSHYRAITGINDEQLMVIDMFEDTVHSEVIIYDLKDFKSKSYPIKTSGGGEANSTDKTKFYFMAAKTYVIDSKLQTMNELTTARGYSMDINTLYKDKTLALFEQNSTGNECIHTFDTTDHVIKCFTEVNVLDFFVKKGKVLWVSL